MRLFWVIRDTIRGFNRVIINGSPRLLTLNSLAWIFIGTSCGMIGLAGRINASFVFALICLGWAAVEIGLALLRSNSWKKAGLIRTLPDGTVFVRVEHVFRESSVSQSMTQIVPFILRAVGDKQEITVACTTCQQNMVFRVLSRQALQTLRMRAAVIAVLCLLAGVGLGIVSAMVQDPQLAGWGFLGALVLFFCSTLTTARLLSYNGVFLIKAPMSPGIWHRARHPSVKADFEELRRLTDSAMKASAQQSRAHHLG